MAKNFFHGMETVLCKVLGVYTIGYQNRVSGKRYMEQVVVMQNLFHERVITRTFDLKVAGSAGKHKDIHTSCSLRHARPPSRKHMSPHVRPG